MSGISHRLALLSLFWLAQIAEAQWVEQTLELVNGWNVVHLHQAPHPAECDAVFSNLPIRSVHKLNPALSPAQFSSDHEHLFDAAPDWLNWRPCEHGEANTLERISAGSYIIVATNACQLTLTGRPAQGRIRWAPGRFTLTGFPLSANTAQQPFFFDYFKNINTVDASKQPGGRRIFTINPRDGSERDLTGRTDREPMVAGKAYWIKGETAGDFSGLLTVAVTGGDTLDFGGHLAERVLYIHNHDPVQAATVTVRHVVSAPAPPGEDPIRDDVPLMVFVPATNAGGHTWAPFDEALKDTIGPSSVWRLRLAVNRAAMLEPSPAYATWQSLLDVSDDRGGQMMVGVRAAYAPAGDAEALWPAGLWVGEAYATHVSHIQPGVTNAPTPAGDAFPIRLILHVNPNGEKLLISEVAAVLDAAESDPVIHLHRNPDAVPATDILWRIRSIAFPAMPPATLEGAMLGALTTTYTLPGDDPRHPFRHIHHPDHGGANRPIANTLTLVWDELSGEPAYGAVFIPPEETTTGTFTKTITNLRKEPITLTGPFTLQRISKIGVLQ